MISTLVMVICLTANCDSAEYWAVASWGGPEAPIRCEAARKAHVQLAQDGERFFCESESQEAI